MLKKYIIFFIFLLLPIVLHAQNKNMLTAWYGNQNSILIEYSRNAGYDAPYSQKYGYDVGIGYNINENIPKMTGGMHGILEKPSGWNPIYKIGVVLYDFRYYDAFLGVGVEKDNLHLLCKLNFMNAFTGNLKEKEWIEFGFGFSF